MGSQQRASPLGGRDMRTLVLCLALSAKALAGPFGFNLPDIGGLPSSHVPTDVLSLSHFAAASKDAPKPPSLTRQAPPGSKVCLTKGCVKAAADLINSMDEAVDPCSDFYNFACGNFIKETVIPDHQTSYGSFSMVRDKLNLRLRKLFEGKPADNEPQAYQNVRNYFQACMDTKGIEEKSVEQLKALLDDIGGWPVLVGDKWEGENFKWHELSMKASDKGFSSDRMISIGISTDDKDSTRRILEVDQPSLGLSREYLIKGADDKDVKAYLQYMVDSAVFLGSNREVALAEMKDALDLELKIAEMTLPREERRNKTALYNTMTIKEASALYPELPWVQYINVILSPDRTVTVDEDEVVNVAVPKYIEEFGKLITTVPARTIANLIMWRNVKSSMSYLNEEAIQIQLAYSKAIGFVVGHEITHGFDDQGSQKDGEGNLVDWWEPETKTRYLEKARCIIEQYGNYTVEVEGETLNVNGI